MPSNLAPAEALGFYNRVHGLLAGIGWVTAPALGGFELGASTNTMVVWAILISPAVPATLLFVWLGSRIPKEINLV